MSEMKIRIKEAELNENQTAILAVNENNEIIARNWYMSGHGASHTNQGEARTELIDDLKKQFPSAEIDARMCV